jgi:hypothetical protein
MELKCFLDILKRFNRKGRKRFSNKFVAAGVLCLPNEPNGEKGLYERSSKRNEQF